MRRVKVYYIGNRSVSETRYQIVRSVQRIAIVWNTRARKSGAK